MTPILGKSFENSPGVTAAVFSIYLIFEIMIWVFGVSNVFLSFGTILTFLFLLSMSRVWSFLLCSIFLHTWGSPQYTQYTSKLEIIKNHSQDWNLDFLTSFEIIYKLCSLKTFDMYSTSWRNWPPYLIWGNLKKSESKIKMLSTMLGCVCALVDGTPIMSTSDLDQLPPDGFARSRIIREFRQIAEYWSKPSLISPSAPNPSTPISCTQAYTQEWKRAFGFLCVLYSFSHSH